MWNNQNPQDKNLEALQHGLHVENIKGYTKLWDSVPTDSEIPEGGIVWAKIGGVVYQYTKIDGVVLKSIFS